MGCQLQLTTARHPTASSPGQSDVRLATSLKKDKLAVNRSQAFRPETCPTSLRTRSNEEEEVYLYMQWPHQLFSPLLQAAQTLKQFADEETLTHRESLMLEGDFETLTDCIEWSG